MGYMGEISQTVASPQSKQIKDLNTFNLISGQIHPRVDWGLLRVFFT